MDDDPSLPDVSSHDGAVARSNLDQIFYSMSVNFLMYVVLIITFYMLIRFYLEEDTVLDEGWNTHPHERAQQDPERSASEAACLLYEEEGNENEGKEERKKSPILGSGVPRIDTSTESNSGSNEDKGFMSRFIPHIPVNFAEWGEPSGTKQEVIELVVFCSLGLLVSFGAMGLFQERILTIPYDGEFFVYSYGLVFVNRFMGLVMSCALWKYFDLKWTPSPLWEYSFPSVANMMSSWCQYEALKYVTFPTQMLFKAFKIVPTMIVGKFMFHKNYAPWEYTQAVMIGIGIYVFIKESETVDFSQNVFGEMESVTGAQCGIALLFCFLCFDSITGQWQNRMFEKNKMSS
jgi:hypothetical protein